MQPLNAPILGLEEEKEKEEDCLRSLNYTLLQIIDIEPGIDSAILGYEFLDVAFKEELIRKREIGDSELSHFEVPEFYGIF